MEIVNLDPRQLKKAAEVVAAAFFDYPMFTFYFPDPKRRAKSLAWYLGNVLKCALRYGEVCTNPEISGVIFTLPPGHTRLTQNEYAQTGFLLTPFVMGLRNFIRSQDCEAFVGDTHERIMQNRPHYYLWGLAVDPRVKGTGIGTALLEPLLSKADREGKPVYLETHDEKNVAYYKKRGFSLAFSGDIPKYGLDIWGMVRDPQ
jgi:GNAT superfamily N-acetyltransferase